MSPRIVTVVVVSSVMVTLTGGCRSHSRNETQPRKATPFTDTGSSTTTARGAPQGGSVQLPQNVALDLEQRHPNGTYVHVTGVSFTRNSISVAVEVINGSLDQVELNDKRIYLLDSVGNGYNFVPPPENPNLQIARGATLRGSLTFLGPVDRRATVLSLRVNVYRATDTVDIASEYKYATAPAFQIDGITVRR